MCDRHGAIYKGRDNLNKEKEEMAEICNQNMEKGTLAEVLKGADVFIGVSAPGTVTEEMVQSMADKPILSRWLTRFRRSCRIWLRKQELL